MAVLARHFASQPARSAFEKLGVGCSNVCPDLFPISHRPIQCTSNSKDLMGPLFGGTWGVFQGSWVVLRVAFLNVVLVRQLCVGL